MEYFNQPNRKHTAPDFPSTKSMKNVFNQSGPRPSRQLPTGKNAAYTAY